MRKLLLLTDTPFRLRKSVIAKYMCSVCSAGSTRYRGQMTGNPLPLPFFFPSILKLFCKTGSRRG